MCFVFLYLPLFRAVEHVSMERRCRNMLIISISYNTALFFSAHLHFQQSLNVHTTFYCEMKKEDKKTVNRERNNRNKERENTLMFAVCRIFGWLFISQHLLSHGYLQGEFACGICTCNEELFSFCACLSIILFQLLFRLAIFMHCQCRVHAHCQIWIFLQGDPQKCVLEKVTLYIDALVYLYVQCLL